MTRRASAGTFSMARAPIAKSTHASEARSEGGVLAAEAK
jgi:hypothetical protein